MVYPANSLPSLSLSEHDIFRFVAKEASRDLGHVEITYADLRKKANDGQQRK